MPDEPQPPSAAPHAGPPLAAAPSAASPAAAPVAPQHRRRWGLWIVSATVLAGVLAVGVPWLRTVLSTVSTDDAYVNGHVTFTAPRVAGQVTRVLVDDNYRVHTGDLLVELDKEPYQVQVGLTQATLEAAQAELTVAHDQALATEGQMRSLRFSLEHAIEDVDNQIASLRLRVATLQSERASLLKAKGDFDRGRELIATRSISDEEFESRREAFQVAEARVQQALQGVYQVRVALGLPMIPAQGDDLTQVPPDLDQTYSAVRQAQFALAQAAAQLGVTDSFDQSPKQMLARFYRRDPQGDINRIFARLLADAPAVKLAEAKLSEARRNLEQARLNLRYCDVLAEIDGVVTRRNVNPGNNVIAGQSLMAVRSLTEIWIDANFKETQLAPLRIGQAVDLDVDMYGRRQRFRGRISGFTMGTGSTLALLPPENATGNFVKVVQRLPVRVELVDYDPDRVPLFIGLSVTPYVLLNQPPTGPNAGMVLQPHPAVAAVAGRPAETPR